MPGKVNTTTTGVERSLRVDKVYELLMAGHRRAEIIRLVSQWECCDKTIDNYINNAGERIEEQAEPMRKREFGRAKRRLDVLFQLTERRDPATALRVQAELNKLLGLYPAETIEHVGEIIVSFGDGKVVNDGESDSA